MTGDNHQKGESRSIEIEPVPFQRDSHKPRSPSPLRLLVWVFIIVIFSLLAFSAWFVFTARQVVINMEPEPDQISIRGGLFAPRIGSNYLMRPGEYTLKAIKQCYQPFQRSIQIAEEKSQMLNLVMEKLHGRLSLQIHEQGSPSMTIDGVTVQIDGEEVGVTPLKDVALPSGRRLLEIRAERYQPLTTYVDIEGCGKFQTSKFALLPGWADVTIRSIPKGADVRIDGSLRGQTPLEMDLFPGSYKLEISADRFKPYRTELLVRTTQTRVLDPIRLEPADGTFRLNTNPAGANVMVGGIFAGKTPLNMPLLPDRDHEVRISKAGYETVVRKVKVSSAGVEKLEVDLAPIEGIVYLEVDPGDAELFVNGKSLGTVRRELRLTSIEQRVEIRKEGYQTFQTKITPRPGFPQELKVTLTKPMPKNVVVPTMIRAANGYALKLIQPGPFTMGASRREQGRRSNETLRKVTLQRPFYLGVREVTNREFREFEAAHSSGFLKQENLDRDDLPVVQVTWEQAALFCNWLSEKDSLPPSYVQRDGKLVAAETLRTGYRLPTEAEWEYSARLKQNEAFMKYPWGDVFPPPANSGNFADISTKDLLPNYLTGYNDGYLATAPPGTFEPNELGLYDMGGNVAEWCHDYYSIYPYSTSAAYVDPLGPEQGQHRVVKGSSWRDGSISELRLSYRDYSQDKSQDLGFRIARYLEDVTEEK